MDPLPPHRREEVLGELENLEMFQALLQPKGIRGLVLDCDECDEEHYISWELLRAGLRHLLDVGTTDVHEPAYDPDPAEYVTWDYAQGYADAVLEHLDGDDEDA